MPVVCGLNLPSEELKARGPGYFSSGIHHRRIGTESSVTRPGCVKPARLNGCASERKSSTNYFLIHPLVGGSQRCKIYLGALLNPIFFPATYSSLRTWRGFLPALYGRGRIPVLPPGFFQPCSRPSLRYQRRVLNGYRYTPNILRCPGRSSIFKLNNGNLTELAMALTQLEFLFLGHPCPENTCLTTVACLVPISVHCNKLSTLGIHFNTTNIVDNFKNTLEDSRFQQLRSLQRCSLKCLNVCGMPLSLDESGSKTVAEGMINIFPSLTHCEGLGRGWGKLSREIRHFRVHSV